MLSKLADSGEEVKMSTAEPIDYEAVLADLRGRRDQLNSAIAVIEQFLGLSPGSTVAAAPTSGSPLVLEESLPKEVQSDTFFGLSAVDAAKKYLAIVKKPMPMKAIHDALRAGGYLTNSKNFYSNLYTSIMRSPDFQKVRKNWGLAEWYQGRRVPTAEPGPSKRKKARKKIRRKPTPPPRVANPPRQEKPSPEPEG